MGCEREQFISEEDEELKRLRAKRLENLKVPKVKNKK
jgi:hypothetical protein